MGSRVSTPADRAGAPPSPLRAQSRRTAIGGTAEKIGPRQVLVLVLGDVGRSPRMQYHAMSLASHGVHVTLIGYKGERCISAVENSPRISCHRFDPPLSGAWGRWWKRKAYLAFSLVKAQALLLRIMYELMRAPKPDGILVQNPPSLPGIGCVFLACTVRRCTMVLDWHNLGFTMFGRGPRHPLVWITRMAEAFFGRRAGVNITVSQAMRSWIKTNFGISEAHVVYDQPPDFFRPPDLPERHALFKRLAKTSPDFAETVRLHTAAMTDATAAAANFGGMHASSDEGLRASSKQARRDARRGASNAAVEDAPEVYGSQNNGDDGGMKVTSHGEREAREERTLFTTRSAEDVYELRRDRPALLVSSTSWTPDEDFSVLLEALERFDSRAASGASPTLPFVVVIVTGKGPQKEEYVKRMKEASMSRVAVCTAWLEPDDYPVLLGSADLGICLHTSTSGVDLPMKVVDMFGCGVPVCAVQFECLKELVQDGHNGCVFKNSTQLALQLEALLGGFPRGGCELQGFRSNVKEVKRWQENWDEFAWPLFKRLGRRRPTRNASTSKNGVARHDETQAGGWSAGAIVEAIVVPMMAVLLLLFLVPTLSDRIQSGRV